ncbi:NEW3 domain-containing protein [Synechococcus sp. W60.2]|uniref:NEW3 domain-containing protein n=1 Tax=Synechococcus sp. W60.2 TaxID=2964521 RepID=UPI0039C3EE6D
MRKGVWYGLLTVWYGLLTSLALLLAACGGQPPPGLTLAQPDLTLVGISPQNPAVVQGETVTLTLTFTSQNGFQGQVSSSVLEGGQPVSWLSPNAVQRNLNVPRGQQVQETLEVQVDPNAPAGSQNLTVQAAYGNQVTERALTLTVSAPGGGGGGDGRQVPDFTISLSPDSLTVQQGSNSQTTLTVTPQSRSSRPVFLALVAGQDQVPQGLTLSPGSVQVPGLSPVNQSLTLSAQPTTPPGTYRLKVRATRRLTQEADLTVAVLTPYTNAYVRQVSGDGSVLVGSALVSGARRPMFWQINAASLSPGFYWLAGIATQTNVLNTGLSSYPYGDVLGVTADGTVGCGYGSVSTSASSTDKALAWDLTTLQPISLPDDPNGGNAAYACAKSGGDVYIVGRVYPGFPTPTIWRNYAIWHQNNNVAYGIFHDITPSASTASAQLVYQGWVYDLSGNQYTQLIPLIGGAFWSRISPDGQAVAFSDSNSGPGIKVWYGGNVYTVNMGVGAVRVMSGVAYVFGGDGSNAVRWRSDTTTMENLNTVFASVLPPGVTLKEISAVSVNNGVIVGIAYNPTTSQNEPFVLVGNPFAP